MYFCLLNAQYCIGDFRFLFLYEFYITSRKDQRSPQFNPFKKDSVYVDIEYSNYSLTLQLPSFLKLLAKSRDDLFQVISLDLTGLFLILEASCNFNLALFLLQLLTFFQNRTQYSIFFFEGSRGFLKDSDLVILKDLFYVIFAYLYLSTKLGVRLKSVYSTCCWTSSGVGKVKFPERVIIFLRSEIVELSIQQLVIIQLLISLQNSRSNQTSLNIFVFIFYLMNYLCQKTFGSALNIQFKLGRKMQDDKYQQMQQKEQQETPQIIQPTIPQSQYSAKQSNQVEWFGINKSLYRYCNRGDLNIKTGLDYQLLPANPHFLQPENEQCYPVFQPKPYILEEAIKKDIQIIIFMNTLLNKIVYDQQDTPLSKGIDPKQHAVDLLPFYVPTSENDTTLVFQARFQSGNLRRAIQILEYQYQIILRADWNTTSHTQWYYFSVANTRKDVQYKFMIINLMKPDSLYNSGMKPLFYSEKLAKEKKTGWYRDGYDICYYQNNLKRKNGDFFHTLTFTVKFPYDNDTVYIAHCYPYTYSRNQNFLRELQLDPKKKHLLQRKTLCQTVAGNNCDYLIISDFNNGKQKKGVFLTSRVHPGETMASFVIEYIIQFLLGNSLIAKILRENFIFKIVPMLNIDGVIIGNYRCNLSLVDLNRQWIDPNKKLHPTIYHTKQLIKRMKEERDLVLYCDFHGHSRKKNCFMYGCYKDNFKKQQIFPAIMKTNCNTFSFKDCCFLIQKDREGASRITLWKQLNIINSYTFQISFCGPDSGKYQFKHFNLFNYRQMAEKFCESIYDFADPQSPKVSQAISDLQQNILKNDKNDDDSGGDDSDYQTVEAPGPNRGQSKGKQQPKPSSGNNQMIIKKKIVPANMQVKKKK